MWMSSFEGAFCLHESLTPEGNVKGHSSSRHIGICYCRPIICPEQPEEMEGTQRWVKGQENSAGAGNPWSTRSGHEADLLLHQHRIRGLRIHLNPSTGVVQHSNTVLIVN